MGITSYPLFNTSSESVVNRGDSGNNNLEKLARSQKETMDLILKELRKANIYNEEIVGSEVSDEDVDNI